MTPNRHETKTINFSSRPRGLPWGRVGRGADVGDGVAGDGAAAASQQATWLGFSLGFGPTQNGRGLKIKEALGLRMFPFTRATQGVGKKWRAWRVMWAPVR